MKLFLVAVLTFAPSVCLAQGLDITPLKTVDDLDLSKSNTCFTSDCCIINKQYVCPPPPEKPGGSPVIDVAPDDLSDMLGKFNEKMRFEQFEGQF